MKETIVQKKNPQRNNRNPEEPKTFQIRRDNRTDNNSYIKINSKSATDQWRQIITVTL